jgi:PAS domain S-box-containing protein
LLAIGNQAAHLIDNARLYADSCRRTEQLAALVKATTAVSTTLKIEQVLEIVAREMVDLLKVDACTISRWDRAENMIRLWIRHTATEWEIDPKWYTPISLNLYPATHAVLTQAHPQQLHLNDPQIDPTESEWMQSSNVAALLMVPLVAQDQTIGLAELMHRTSRAFSHQEIILAQTLGNQAAIAIENARLYEETQRQLKVSTLLNEASAVISSSLDINKIMQSLLAQMNEFLNVEALSIALVDELANELVYEVAEGFGSDKIVGLRLPSNQGISGWVMEHGEPALVPDTAQDNRFYRQGDQRTGHPTRAIICAPLKAKGQVLGTIQAINPLQGTFTENDLQLLVNLANLASSAIANAQQFAHTQAAEARYLGLFEDSIDPIILTDTDGYIIEANRRAGEALGYELPELLRFHISALHPIKTGLLGRAQFEPIRSNQVKIFTSQAITKSKEKIPVEVHAKRIFKGDHEFLQWIHHDISKQVALEEMREDLMAMLFHDLQSPLGNIISSLDLLNFELPPDASPTIFTILNIAKRSSHRLQTLVRSLLDINRLEAGHPLTNRVSIDIYKLIRDAQEIVEPHLAKRHIMLVFKLAPGLPDVYVDDDMIRRVLANLLDNAVKFSADNQQIMVEVTETAVDAKLTVSVSDQGNGIPEEHRQSIFDKFRRLHSKDGPKGMGLGLAFCRLAIEAHGGQIWVDDAPGGGARFTFTLPTRPYQIAG